MSWLLIFTMFLGSWSQELVVLGQAANNKKIEPDEVAGIWWTNNRMGGNEGLELSTNGQMRLLDWELFNGVGWEITDNQLILEMKNRRTNKLDWDTMKIVSLTPDKMTLDLNDHGATYTYIYERNQPRDFVDSLYGHWDGADGNYIQVIQGVNSFEPKVIFGNTSIQGFKKYEGYVNEALRVIEFEDEKGENSLHLVTPANQKPELHCAKKIFRK